MNTCATFSCFIGVAALLFGAWGRHSDAGKKRFDEMAGIIPELSWYAGIGLVILAVSLWIVIWMRR